MQKYKTYPNNLLIRRVLSIKILLAFLTASNWLILLLSSNTISTAQTNNPNLAKAFRSCGEREPMSSNDFVKLVADKRINYQKAEIAFERMTLYSSKVMPNFKRRKFSAPNLKGNVEPDAVEPYIDIIQPPNTSLDDAQLIGRWNDSVFYDAKTSGRITLDDTNGQVAKYLDYLANMSPASTSTLTGDNKPVPFLVFITLADTVVEQDIVDIATEPGLAKPTYKTGNQRRVAVWQRFACKPTWFEKFRGADIVVGEGILLNPQIENLEGFQEKELFLEPGTPIEAPEEFIVPKGNAKTSSLEELFKSNSREFNGGGIKSPTPPTDPTPPPTDPTPPPSDPIPPPPTDPTPPSNNPTPPQECWLFCGY